MKRLAGWAFALLAAPLRLAADAPYRSPDDLRQGAGALLQQLLHDGPAVALQSARANSHLGDPKVQANLDWAAQTLPARLAPLGACQRVQASDEERFASSFMRFHFVLDCQHGQRHFMLTYRRKNDGWRLNQFYFD